MNPIEKFLLDYFEVSDLKDINPYAYVTGNVKCWEPAQDVVYPLQICGPQETFIQEGTQPRNPYGGMEYNLQEVSITTIFVRYAKCEQTSYHVQCNFVTKTLQAAEKDYAKMVEAAGFVPGCFSLFEAHTNGACEEYAFRSPPENFYLHEGFVKTMAYINRANIMNGIIALDPELTQNQLATQTQVMDEKGNPITIDINKYFLVPADHILSWKLHLSDYWRRLKGLFSYEIRIDTDTEKYLLYYCVCDCTFYRLLQEFELTWLEKVDKRPIDQIGFNFIPNQKTPQGGSIVLDTVINYTCFPIMTDEMINGLIPTLHPHFMPYEKVLQNQNK